MLSDESSSDSETGRFKSTSTDQKKEITHNFNKRDETLRSGRDRTSDNDRLRRDFNRRRDHFETQPHDQHRSKHSSARRRYSRERSPDRRRRSHERSRHTKNSIEPSNSQRRSSSKDRRRHSRSRSHKSPDLKRNFKEEIKRNILPVSSKESSSGKYDRDRTWEKRSSSPDLKTKRSVVQKPELKEIPKPKSFNPIVVDVEKHPEIDISDDDQVQLGSYYSMIPAIVKEKSFEKEVTEESSEIDSSDDERLRAKLLNLEKELNKTKKKKHKKKHKRKSSKSKREKDRDTSASVEVTSTTDIQLKEASDEISCKDVEIVEVSSTQKINLKESSEEGEILSDDCQSIGVIDPNDLRHKLKKSAPAVTSLTPDLRTKEKSKTDMCGPALPPHLVKRFRKNSSPDIEGPLLPPHLQKKERNIGPMIPSDMRKVLAEADNTIVKCDSSEEDDGIGPLPVGAESKWSDAHKLLEERALDIKIKKMDGHTMQQSDVKTREKWMLELPEAKAKIIGLEARSFRAKEGPDMSDRSSWTDTPEEKARKAMGVAPVEETTTEALQKEAHARRLVIRDDAQEKEVKKHKKKHKREESLLEMHQKKLKKKKKKEEKEDGKTERRPFSRDVDLQVNRFDEAQKKSIIKKAQALDSRFSAGEAKFL